MVSVPLVVTTSAVYRFSGSMTIGGGPSKRWVFGLEPSAAGISGVMAPVPRVVCGGMGVVRPEVGAAGRRAGPGRSGLGDGHRVHAVEGDGRTGAAGGDRAAGVDLLDHVHAGGHLPEQRVAGGQVLTLGAGHDEELAVVGVGSRICLLYTSDAA